MPSKLFDAKLIDAVTQTCLENLQKIRHLCAHPVQTGDNRRLFTPSQHEVYGYLRNTFDLIFSIDQFLSKSSFDQFAEDLEAASTSLLPSKESSQAFLHRHYDRLSTEVTKNYFRNLWRLCFKSKNQRCIDNYHVNFLALRELYKYRKTYLDAYLRENSSDFSEVKVQNDFLKNMANDWFSLFPSTFAYVSKELQAHIKSYCEREFKSSYTFAFTLDEYKKMFVANLKFPDENDFNFAMEVINFMNHPQDAAYSFIECALSTYYSAVALEQILKFSDNYNMTQAVLDILRDKFPTNSEKINMLIYSAGDAITLRKNLADNYTKSSNFDTADSSFLRLEPFLKDFSYSELEDLLAEAKKNSQCMNRRRASSDHNRLEDLKNILARAAGSPA
ncbi:MAG TPA: hypothetical protein VE954_12635 [Oligoflexus sp.]|uniref:hypothetical protein n=1 Tax=Oligoflexus sp. TaxID=1971216 RepID=UPI002D4575BA|nr:hypothetical protein [Oligoflexus sp.]HYX33954.1 hypothetical protein [Oligoflexus sp.]